jgi:hypothetical protein
MEVNSHENPDDISVVSDFAQTPWIYDVPGGAGCALAGELNNLGGHPTPEMTVATPLSRVAQNADSDHTPVQRTGHSN